MPWIKQIPIAEATGLLKAQFDAALKRAGRVPSAVGNADSAEKNR